MASAPAVPTWDSLPSLSAPGPPLTGVYALLPLPAKPFLCHLLPWQTQPKRHLQEAFLATLTPMAGPEPSLGPLQLGSVSLS